MLVKCDVSFGVGQLWDSEAVLSGMTEGDGVLDLGGSRLGGGTDSGTVFKGAVFAREALVGARFAATALPFSVDAIVGGTIWVGAVLGIFLRTILGRGLDLVAVDVSGAGSTDG